MERISALENKDQLAGEKIVLKKLLAPTMCPWGATMPPLGKRNLTKDESQEVQKGCRTGGQGLLWFRRKEAVSGQTFALRKTLKPMGSQLPPLTEEVNLLREKQPLPCLHMHLGFLLGVETRRFQGYLGIMP